MNSYACTLRDNRALRRTLPPARASPAEGPAVERALMFCTRRAGLPRENPFVFYPRYFGETAIKNYLSGYSECKAILDEVLAAPDRWTDTAIAPPKEDEFEMLDLYHATAGGEAALERKHRGDAIRAGMLGGCLAEVRVHSAFPLPYRPRCSLVPRRGD